MCLYCTFKSFICICIIIIFKLIYFSIITVSVVLLFSTEILKTGPVCAAILCVFLPKHSHYCGYTAIINFTLTAIEKLFVWGFFVLFIYLFLHAHTGLCVC